MPGGYSVTISAVDAATQTFDGINKRIEAMNKRILAAQAPFKRLGDQMNKFAKVTGISAIATGFKDFGIAANEAWRSVSRVVEPLAAITGAASLAGVYRLTEAWADFGTTLGIQSRRAGVSADQLYNLQNAAKLAGIDAGALTSSLTTMNDHMRDAAFGAAPAFLVTLRTLGLSFEALKHQNPEQRLRAIADALRRVQNPTDRAMYTREIFGGEDLQHFLRDGAAGIAQYEAQARHLAGSFTDPMAAHATAFQRAQHGLIESIDGLGNAIGDVLGPALTPVLGDLSEIVVNMRKWVEANQGWLRNEISKKVGEFVTWLKQVDWAGLGTWIEDIAKQANAVANALGGWETVGKGVLAFFIGRWLIMMLTPFALLGIAVGKLTWMIGTGLVDAFKWAGDAAVIFNKRSMALPVFRVLAATMGLLDRMQNGTPVDQLPPDSPLRRVQPDGSQGQDGGWLGGIRRFFGLDPMSRAPGAPALTTAQQQSTARIMADVFASHGYTREGQAALIGNSIQESGLRTNPGGNMAHQGLFQLDSARRQRVEQHYGMPLTRMTAAQQAEAAAWEIDTDPRFALTRAGVHSHNLSAASGAVTGNFEVPALPGTPAMASEQARRLALSQRAADWLNQGPAAALPAATGAPAPLPSSQPGQAGANGKVDMNVRILGQPAVVTSKTSGDVDLNVANPGLVMGY